MYNLKQCPFCGNIPTTKVEIASFGGNTDKIIFSIECEKCGTRKSVGLSFLNYSNFDEVEKTITKAIEVWNKRANNE